MQAGCQTEAQDCLGGNRRRAEPRCKSLSNLSKFHRPAGFDRAKPKQWRRHSPPQGFRGRIAQFFGKCRFSMHERVPLLEGLRLDAVKTIPANFALGWLCYVFERASIGNDDRTS